MSDALPIVIEYLHPAKRIGHAFAGRVRREDGSTFKACIKPQVPVKPGAIEHVYADWCGSAIADRLGLPVPRLDIVELEVGFLRRQAHDLPGVRPGIALASEWVEGSQHCGVLTRPNPDDIQNPETVAGMVVSDTAVRNQDRGNDVLWSPAPGSASPRYTLSYIDNGWLVWLEEAASNDIEGQLPWNDFLRALFGTGEHTAPFLFEALALVESDIAARFSAAPSELIAESPAAPEDLARVIVWRAREAISAIARAQGGSGTHAPKGSVSP